MTTTENHHSENAYFGFWLYLMTDLISFSALFAVFAVLRYNTAGGSGGEELFSLPFALTETFILLFSSFICGLVLVSAQQNKIKAALSYLGLTFCLGLSFLGMEIWEFSKLIGEGNGPSKSAFLSSFFALVGAHGLHIVVGLLWLLVLFTVLSKKGLSSKNFSNLRRFVLFWHFLDLVWIFIFSFVYLIGKI